MSLYSVGLSGLNTAQIVLGNTSKNISNINTPGYNRQVANLAENSSGGVKVTSLERQFNLFVAGQLNDANSTKSALTAYKNQIHQIDALLADTDSGLAKMMQGFFSSLQSLAGAPSDPAARQGVIGSADNLTAQFRSMSGYLEDLHTGINGEVQNQVIQINNLADQIAKLNKEITLSKAKTGEAPNELMNQRDELVANLAERVDIRLNIQDSGTYNISISNGLSLVAGNTSFKLKAVASYENPTRMTVGYVDGGNNLIQIPEKSIKGGELGGVLAFRSEALDSAQNRLGQLALGLTMGFNEQHMAGVDFEGNPGTAFFESGSPKVFGNERNTGGAVIAGDFNNLSQVGLADYKIEYSAVGGYTVTDRTSGQSVATYPAGTTSLTFGGMTLDVTGTPADGDTFLVKPLQYVTQDFQNVITDVGQIAAGLPTGATGTADNRNALALQNLQFKSLLSGSSSLNQGYSALVNDIGNRSQITMVNEVAHTTLSEQLRAVQQSESGVNLDEEAVNLLRYQQYYQASARIIDTATTVIDTILNLKN